MWEDNFQYVYECDGEQAYLSSTIDTEQTIVASAQLCDVALYLYDSDKIGLEIYHLTQLMADGASTTFHAYKYDGNNLNSIMDTYSPGGSAPDDQTSFENDLYDVAIDARGHGEDIFGHISRVKDFAKDTTDLVRILVQPDFSNIEAWIESGAQGRFECIDIDIYSNEEPYIDNDSLWKNTQDASLIAYSEFLSGNSKATVVKEGDIFFDDDIVGDSVSYKEWANIVSDDQASSTYNTEFAIIDRGNDGKYELLLNTNPDVGGGCYMYYSLLYLDDNNNLKVQYIDMRSDYTCIDFYCNGYNYLTDEIYSSFFNCDSYSYISDYKRNKIAVFELAYEGYKNENIDSCINEGISNYWVTEDAQEYENAIAEYESSNGLLLAIWHSIDELYILQ